MTAPPIVEVLILCPLALEWAAIVSKLDKPSVVSGEMVSVKVGEIGGHKIACARCGKYEEKAAARAGSLIEKHKPWLVIVVGIAGAFPDSELRRGDIIIARDVYGVGGKVEKGKFERRSDLDWRPNALLVENAENFGETNPDWVNAIGLNRPDGKTEIAPRIYTGYVVSLDITVDDFSYPFVQNVLRTIEHRVDAVEMESSGVGAAIESAQASQICVGLMVRAISDEIPSASGPEQASGPKQRKDWRPYSSEVAATFVSAFLFQLPVQAQHAVEASIGEAISERAHALRINLDEGLGVVGGTQSLEAVVDEVLDAVRKRRELAMDFNITGYSEIKARIDELEKKELTESVLEERYKLREQIRTFECWDQPVDQLLREVPAVVIRNLYADRRHRFLSNAHEIAASMSCCFRMLSERAPFIVGIGHKFDVYHKDSGWSFGIHVPKEEVDKLMSREDVPNISYLQGFWGLNIRDFTWEVQIEQIIPAMVFEYLRLKYAQCEPPDEKQYFDIHKWKVGLA